MRIETLSVIVGLALLGFGIARSEQQARAPHVPAKAHKADLLFARAKPDDFLGDSACVDCHEERAKNFATTPHAAFMSDPKLPLSKRGCEGCHGPAGIHRADENPEVISFRKETPEDSAAACLRCHAQTLSERHWKRTEHAKAGLSCVSCHLIHSDGEPALEPGAIKKGNASDPRKPVFVARVDGQMMLKTDEITMCGQCHAAQTNEFRQPNHHPVPEGKMLCSDCHSPHPTKDSKIRNDSVKGRCVTCHADKAGPFVYEHDPMTGGQGCQECHRPHGSNNPLLLNGMSRGVCAQCHTDKLANHFAGQTCWTAGCHVAPHGSNTDPTFRSH